MGDFVDRLKERRLCSAHLPNVIHAVCECVRWNPLCKQKRITTEMSMPTQSISRRILHDDLKFRAYRCCVSRTLTQARNDLSNSLCCSSATIQGEEISKHSLLGWEDFPYPEKLNRQNDRVHAQNCYEAREKMSQVTHRHQSPPVMVWWDV